MALVVLPPNYWQGRKIPILYRRQNPFSKRAGYQRWHDSQWYSEWEQLAYEGRQYKEPRPYFPDAPQSNG